MGEARIQNVGDPDCKPGEGCPVNNLKAKIKPIAV